MHKQSLKLRMMPAATTMLDYVVVVVATNASLGERQWGWVVPRSFGKGMGSCRGYPSKRRCWQREGRKKLPYIFCYTLLTSGECLHRGKCDFERFSCVLN